MVLKRQILIIRGGEAFEKEEDYLEYIRTEKLDPYENTKNWRDWIIWALSETHDVLVPLMPCKQKAEYKSWKIWFERHFEFLQDENPSVIGHSLGATFLLKYLSENNFPRKIKQLHLIAPATTNEPPLYLERLATFKFDLSKINAITKNCEEVHVWYSEDDDLIPQENFQIARQYLPDAIFHVFTNRGHFRQPAFMELLQSIQNVK